ncbi:MAG: nicotinate (nicotinamide) nucleotide adenylyltransferase [Planctomycetia bacterium]|nr:nicotinate (nicotinamide) nucleotide adenylyltransferase [Planctomycetia bacterium]
MRIGMYGGTFDPIHYGHLLLAESARQQMNLDKVIFVPAGIPPHKRDWTLAPEKDRIAMLELAIRGNAAFEIDRYEIDSPNVSYTVHTLEYLHERYPGAEFFLLLGEDMLRSFPHWREPQRICELAPPLVIGRAGREIEDLDFLSGVASPEKMEQIKRSRIHMIQVAYSSSEIRDCIAQGKSIRYQTPPEVIEYIQKNALYGYASHEELQDALMS